MTISEITTRWMLAMSKIMDKRVGGKSRQRIQLYRREEGGGGNVEDSLDLLGIRGDV